jgi:hypothetical protein
MPQRDWEKVFSIVCGFEQPLRVLFIVFLVFDLLTLISVFTVDPGSGTYLIVLYNLTLFTGGLVVVSIILRKCGSFSPAPSGGR